MASAAYDSTSWQAGSWWAGILSFITGVVSTGTHNNKVPNFVRNRCGSLKCVCRGIVVAGCVLSVISILLCIAGVIFDGVMYNTTQALDFCWNQETGESYGNLNYYPEAVNCAYDHSQTCLCVQSSNDNVCFLFNLNSAENCGQILTKLPALLLTSLIFVLLHLALVFMYSLFTCIYLCSPAVPPAAHHPNPVVSPSVIAVATPAGQPVPVKHVPVTVNEV